MVIFVVGESTNDNIRRWGRTRMIVFVGRGRMQMTFYVIIYDVICMRLCVILSLEIDRVSCILSCISMLVMIVYHAYVYHVFLPCYMFPIHVDLFSYFLDLVLS